MDIFLTIFFPVIFLSTAVIGAKPMGKGAWNEEFLGLRQMKALQGFSALGIVFHHMAQKTAAPWLESQYIHHGLDVFVSIGTFFVSVFLFSSGFGLYKSVKTKNDYLKGFFRRRYVPVLVTFFITSFIFLAVGHTLNPYSWYIWAIFYLYLAFYIAFRKFKKDVSAFIFVGFAIILYSVAADFFMLGTWCYNTIGMFWVGMIIAKNEKKVTSFLKKRYIPMLAVSAIVMFGMYYAAQFMTDLTFETTAPSMYHLYRISAILAQFSASSGFVFLILMIGMKVKTGNKALDFLGGMSLEMYLIHGIFVQLFSYCFIDEPSDYYIESVPLYVLVVVPLSVISAFLLFLTRKYVVRFLDWFAEKEKAFLDIVKHDIKKWAIVISIIVIVPTAVLSINFLTKRSEKVEKVKAYEAENIVYADVDGKKMAAYVVGDENSSNTLVFMRGGYDPCPTLSLKALADELSADYRVVVPDFFGSGFSEDTEKERNAENIADEVHEAVKSLGISGKYVLLPQQSSGLYAMYYVSKYPDEVEAVIGIDAYSEPLWRSEYSEQNAPVMDYKRLKNVQGSMYFLGARLIYNTGLQVFVESLVDGIFTKGFGITKLDVPNEQFFSHFYNSSTVEEMKNEYDSYQLVKGMKLPNGVKFTDIRSIEDNSELENQKQKISEINSKLCDNPNDYELVAVSNVMYCVYSNVKRMHEIIDNSLTE